MTKALVALGAAGAFVFWLLPAAPRRVDTAGWNDLAARTIPGAYHVHTTRSDGHGDRQQVAAAAARAGLSFVVLTDHGDATRPPDPPAYVNGVLLLDAVEISTDQGHLVAIDMPRAPYPLGGTAAAVVEDVHRLGGFAIAAHPDSPKPALRWTDAEAPIDGIEWINADSEWRDETRATLAKAGLAYLLRSAGALAALLDRPATMERWAALSRKRPIVALAAADAHGGPGQRTEDQGRTFFGTIGIPGYEASFRTLSNRVILDRPLTGDPAADGRSIYAALRSGHVFSSIDAIAGPALVDMHFEAGVERSPMGSVLPDDVDGAIVAKAAVPAGSEISIVHDGRIIARSQGPEVRHVVTAAKGTYHVEVSVPKSPGQPPVPWLVSNGMAFLAGQGMGSEVQSEEGTPAVLSTAAPFPWRIEKDPHSSAILRTDATSAVLEFRLGEGERAGQFVALASDLHQQEFAVVDLSLAGDRPMRVSVQLRTADGARWGRSYYVAPSGTRLHVPVAALSAIGAADPAAITSARATSLLLVVDLTNASPGGRGTLKVLSSALSR